MYISRVQVGNVRGFNGPRAVDLTLTRPDGTYAGWTVVAGRNGSGKTTLLRAMAVALGGEAMAYSLGLGFDNWVSSGSDYAAVMATVQFDPALDLMRSRRKVQPRHVMAGVVWKIMGGGDNSFEHVAMYVDSAESIASVVDVAYGESAKGWLLLGYGPFRRLTGIDGRSPGGRAERRLATLFDENSSLVEGVGWLVQQHLRALEGRKGAEDLKDAVLRVLADGLLPDDFAVRGVDSDGLWVLRGERSFPLREMSDGYRTVTALVVDMISQIHEAYGRLTLDGTVVMNPGVVLIDEVDAHLHVSWQKRIGGWLTEHFPNIQFIVTTHSPYVCQAADPGGLIRLPGPDEETPPQIVDDDLYGRIVYGSGDDVVLSELFGLETGYSDRARELRRELSLLEAKVVNGHATDGEVERYRELGRTLMSSPAARADELAARMEAARSTDQ
ncbi:MAG TPA: AAA family ATPase [Kutzneria sp.]|jgi:predicted ATPase|nr:AAA family ATPase [Kutzneria sp.]